MWNKPYHAESGLSGSSHGRVGTGQAVPDTKTLKVEQQADTILDRIKKPFMPTTWKWFRTSGEAKTYTYQPRVSETTKLSLDVPRQFWPYIVDSSGKSYQSSGSKLNIPMSSDDYLEMGARKKVIMQDSETKSSVSTTFPVLKFTVEGKPYELDWEKFARERKIAEGAWDEDWGYSNKGKPTLGAASMYDKTLNLNWDNQLPWWWIILAGIGLLAILKFVRG